LARRAGYGRTYVTLLESGRIVPGREAIRRLGEALAAQEELLRLRAEAEAALQARRDAAARREEARREARLEQWRAEHGISDVSPADGLSGAVPDAVPVGDGMVLLSMFVGERSVLRGMYRADPAAAQALLARAVASQVPFRPLGEAAGVG